MVTNTQLLPILLKQIVPFFLVTYDAVHSFHFFLVTYDAVHSVLSCPFLNLLTLATIGIH